MSQINVLDQNTINKIAAGEVIERPAAVVKELVENAIDAGSNAITIEIKEGGTRFIRITDNGSGISNDDVKVAFLPHATSKIKTVEDLFHVSSLGFRGEALSSIASVSQVELVTKTTDSLMGVRYTIEGGEEKTLEEVGCPEGTTFIIRNLFYNTPARNKFLKSPTAEAGYISDLIEHLAVSHPNISFKFLNNNQLKLHTSGNNNLKDIIYHIYGREITSNLLNVSGQGEQISLQGFIGKPIVSRGNRNYENYFINGRYIKSTVISKAIEEAYRPYSMTHRYPFTAIHFMINSNLIDVNVHPTKMEIRFHNNDEVYKQTYHVIQDALKEKELIPNISLETKTTEKVKMPVPKIPEPFEKVRIENIRSEKVSAEKLPIEKVPTEKVPVEKVSEEKVSVEKVSVEKVSVEKIPEVNNSVTITSVGTVQNESLVKENDNYNSVESNPHQLNLFEDKLLSKEAIKEHRIIGQLFSTYWIIEYKDKMFLIDQHAAHEKVLYEKMLRFLEEKTYQSQMIHPPLILTLSMREEETLKNHLETLSLLGFEIEHFGGREYSVRAVPNDLLGIAEHDLLIELIDSLMEEVHTNVSTLLLEKVASMACKAAVKGNQLLSYDEAATLIDELLTLENPYHCPHGRPVIISMSKYDIEKKFKRIL